MPDFLANMNKPTRQYFVALLRAWLDRRMGRSVPWPQPEANVDLVLVRRLLVEHKVEAALGPHLPEELQEDAFLDRIREARLRTGNLLMELERILPALTWDQCQPIVLKGAALALEHYEDPGERWFVDLDILVPREHLDEACSRLEKCGYRPFWGTQDASFYEQYHFHRVFLGPQGSCVEIHWDLVAPESSYGFDLDGLFGRALTAKLGRHEVRLASTVDQILHGVYQNLADGFLDLRRVMDMGLLMHKLSESDWLYLVKEARRAKMESAFYIWLHVVKEFFEIEAPVEVTRQMNPGWFLGRTLRGVDVTGALLNRSAEKVEGFTYFLQLILAPGLSGRMRHIRQTLFAGEATLLLDGQQAGQGNQIGARLRIFLYYAKELLLAGPRVARALLRS
jgi:hypothetical protein